MKIFLSVGHSILKGGTKTSASGYVNEYDFNKALAPYVKKSLEKRGHNCDIIICPEFRFTSKRQEYSYKIPIANSGKYDLVCELHLNASNGQGNGMECFYYPKDRKGLAIANRMCKEFANLGFKNRGAKTASLYMINDTKPTAVLVESFFCDNKYDTDLAKRVGYAKIGEAIAVGLVGGSVEPVKPTKPEGGYSVLTNTPDDTLNVRQEANATSKILSTYRDKSKIYVHEVVKNTAGTWYKIEYNKNKFGYVSAKFCVGIK